MAEKITKAWLKQVLTAARTIAEKFSLTAVVENLQQSENKLGANTAMTARASDFTSFNEAMSAFAIDTYLSQTRNDEYEDEAKKIKYTIFSGKVGDKFSSSLKQNIDAAVKSWGNIKCVYSYTCTQGKCPNDKWLGTKEIICQDGTCKQGYVSCTQGTNDNDYYEPRICSTDSTYPNCKRYAYQATVSCKANGACTPKGTFWCNEHSAASSRNCTKKIEIDITQSCENGPCSQGIAYDIRCDKTTEAEDETDRT